MDKRARIHPEDTPVVAGPARDKVASAQPAKLSKQALEQLDRDPVRRLVDRAAADLTAGSR